LNTGKNAKFPIFINGKPMGVEVVKTPLDAKDWYAAVASLEICVRCGSHGVQVAHRNFGKGMGLKVPPHLVAALCPACHFSIDQGRELSRAERRAEMNAAIVATFDLLVQRGKIGLL